MRSKSDLHRRTILAMAAALVATEVPAPALVINTQFSSNVTSLSYASQVESAVNYVVQQYEGLYSNPITINIDVDTETTGFSNSETAADDVSYQTVYNALSSLSTTSDQISGAASLPTTNPISSSDQWDIPLAEEKALGLRSGNNSALDGTFLFNTSESWNFDPYDRAQYGYYDFVGAAEHEISEIMGRTPGLGVSKIDGSRPSFVPFDLYRFYLPGVRNFNQGTTAIYFSYDDGNTRERYFNPSTAEDLQDWDSSLNDSYNAFSAEGVQNSLSNADVSVMDVLGYNRGPSTISWQGGAYDFLTENRWTNSNGASLNPFFGAFLYIGSGGNAYHYFTEDENFTLSSNSDMGQTVEVSKGLLNIGLSGPADTNTAGLLVNQDGLLLVDTNGAVDTAGEISVGDAGGVTNALAEFYETAEVLVGTSSGTAQLFDVGKNGTGSVYQYNNSFVSTPALTLGDNTLGNGSYNLQDSSRLSVNGNEVIGENGIGNFTQNGGTHSISGTLSIGNNYKSQGTMTITAGTLTAGYEEIGFFGTGTLNQQGGTQTVSNYITLGNLITGVGTLTVSGGTLLDDGNAYVGGGTLAAGGSGALNVSGGAMTVAGALTIYDPNGLVNLFSGTLTAGSLTDSGDPTIFKWTGGTLHLTGQQLDFISGTDPQNANPLGGALTLGSGQTLQVDSTESLSGSGSTVTQNAGSANACPTIQIGSGGAYNLTGGTLNTSVIYLNSGGTFAESSATVSFTTFNQSGGSATFSDRLTLGPAVYNLSGGTLTTGSSESIGYLNIATGNGGVGTFNQTGGTHTASSIFIGGENTGTYNLSSPGILNVTGSVEIGEFSTGSTFNVGGTATVGSLIVFNYPQTVVTIDGGSLTSGSTINYGVITQTGGSSNLGPVTGNGTINVGNIPVNAGKIPTTMVVTSLRQGTLNIQTQGLLKLTGGTNNEVDSLNITSGYLDLTDSSLLIDYSGGPDPIASIAAWIKSGYANGSWNGIGIMSSAAQNNPGYGIGYADSADPGNPANLPSDTIEIMYTLLGDANLDGTVNSEDFTPFAHNLGQSGMAWDQGDFNYDGTVNAEDFTSFSHNIGQSATLASHAGVLQSADGLSVANVPEPASAVMTLMAGLGILLRRRRSSARTTQNT